MAKQGPLLLLLTTQPLSHFWKGKKKRKKEIKAYIQLCWSHSFWQGLRVGGIQVPLREMVNRGQWKTANFPHLGLAFPLSQKKISFHHCTSRCETLLSVFVLAGPWHAWMRQAPHPPSHGYGTSLSKKGRCEISCWLRCLAQTCVYSGELGLPRLKALLLRDLNRVATPTMRSWQVFSETRTRYLLAPICSTWNRLGHLHFATWRVTCTSQRERHQSG